MGSMDKEYSHPVSPVTCCDFGHTDLLTVPQTLARAGPSHPGSSRDLAPHD